MSFESDLDRRQRFSARLRSTMSAERAMRSDRIIALNKTYFETKKDLELAQRLDCLVDNSVAALEGGGSKERALFVIGESGSGKTTAIKRALRVRPEFKSYVDGNGVRRNPVLAFPAPARSTPISMAAYGIRKMGFPLMRLSSEGEMSELLHAQLKLHEKLYLYIDEMQHGMRGHSAAAIKSMQDTLKVLVQDEDWPVHAVFAGTPILEALFDEDGQIAGRSLILRLRSYDYENDAGIFMPIMKTIVLEDAKLEDGGVLDTAFLRRVMVAANNQFGSIIQLVRFACVMAFHENVQVLRTQHFARAFHYMTARPPELNFFVAANWQHLPPATFLSKAQREGRERVPSRTKTGRVAA